ncbi:hypothetical protein [Micromonospora haikouensis]|uniref:hypothetical protein n=1 Tax=Micromonospora haikouensis TaxID=686309 RepID=UPI000ACCB53B|nr:hypothetical protein [Micromonospora haikouensis]
MWIANLEPVMGAGPWVVAAIGVPVAGMIIITYIALRGTEGKDRAAIIKAIAELFRWRR